MNRLRIAYGTARWVEQDLHFAATLNGLTRDIILDSSQIHSGRGSHAAVAVDANLADYEDELARHFTDGSTGTICISEDT